MRSLAANNLGEPVSSMFLTQEDLTFQGGYHATYISQLERGKKSPSLRAIMNLATALKTRGSQLVKRVEELDTKTKENPA